METNKQGDNNAGKTKVTRSTGKKNSWTILKLYYTIPIIVYLPSTSQPTSIEHKDHQSEDTS